MGIAYTMRKNERLGKLFSSLFYFDANRKTRFLKIIVFWRLEDWRTKNTIFKNKNKCQEKIRMPKIYDIQKQ